MRRVWVSLALLLWVGAVSVYWRTFVPFVPSASFPIDSTTRYGGQTRSGEIVLVTKSEAGPQTGPIQVLVPFTGELLRSFAGADDNVLAFSRLKNFAVLSHAGDLDLLNLRTGERETFQRGVGEPEQVVISDDGQRLGSLHGRVLTMWDTAERRELWSRSLGGAGGPVKDNDVSERWGEVRPLRPEGFVGGHLLKLLPFDSSAYSLLVDATSGGLDKRFIGMEVSEVSPDEGLVLLFGRSDLRVHVYEFSGGRPLWSVPLAFGRGGLHFSSDSRRVNSLGNLISDEAVRGGQLIQWDAWKDPPDFPSESLGKPLTNPHGEVVNAMASADAQYAVILREFQPKRIPSFAYGTARFFGIPLPPTIGTVRERIQVAEQPSGDVIGIVPPGQIELIPPGAGFLVRDETGVRCYTFSPRRNWWWFLGWSLGPPAGLWLLTVLRKRFRLGLATNDAIPG